MSILQTLGTGTGWLKAGFLGFAKSGKSYTAVLLACGLKRHLNLPGSIVMFDTESGSEYVAALVKRETETDLVGVRSRSFSDMMLAARECEEIGAAVFLVDSITHPWRELCDAYLRGINDVRRAKGQPTRQRLEFQDWANIKAAWAPWTDWYLNSQMHIIICGRAGYEYDFEDREDGGRDLVKTGIKMKTEGEFGFEPSLLVEMERIMDLSGDQKRIIHRATVLGDRFGVLDGHTQDNPMWDFFRPHVEMLVPGAHAPVDTTVKTDAQINDEGDTTWVAERRTRKILCEEIEGEMVRRWPSQSKDDRAAKLAALEQAFNTLSWVKVESLDSAALRRGLEEIRALPTGSKEETC